MLSFMMRSRRPVYSMPSVRMSEGEAPEKVKNALAQVAQQQQQQMQLQGLQGPGLQQLLGSMPAVPSSDSKAPNSGQLQTLQSPPRYEASSARHSMCLSVCS